MSAAGDVTGTITMAARSVDIKNKRRDEHLRSADFFDVVNHPDISPHLAATAPGSAII